MHYHQKRHSHQKESSDLSIKSFFRNKRNSHLSVIHSNLTLDESAFLDLSLPKRSPFTVAASQEEENYSLESSTNSTNSINSSNSSHIIGSEISIGDSSLNLNKLNNNNNHNLASNMIMTASNTTSNSSSYPVSSVSSQINVNYSQFTSSPDDEKQQQQHMLPIVKQPQFVTNSLLCSSSSNILAKSFQNPNNPTQLKQASSQVTSANKNNNAKNSENSTNSNTNNKITSLSYLDESNLKIACVEYIDLLRLIKLQNCMDQNEWLAFNSK